ncbi:hypothetical protein KBJ98_02090 [Flavobacterium sp. F-328]|uniref:Uncharacterized protein n=1 Tax=Flavobacterium erciyesense TaxID=2825842 RepID=A0ABS5D0E7_9FLAO|nr:hypothetical protein [Flavobacterium erciyesense]MBQ0907486.1 hypothetical protein [Flavobacterium erciyesense]
MNKFLEQILGTNDVPTYLAWFLLAFIGAFTAILIRAKAKYKTSDDTPRKWSWGFLLQDNAINLLLGFFITFIFLRFSQETLKLEPSAWVALLVGATNNELSLLFVKFGLKARK